MVKTQGLKIIVPIILSLLCSCAAMKNNVKIITVTGTRFSHVDVLHYCFIDSTSVPCAESRRAYNEYLKNIRKCNPCWLISKNYEGNVISEGYAIRYNNGSHHHFNFGERITYTDGGDTLTHKIDSTMILDDVLKRTPSQIRDLLRKKPQAVD